MFIFPDSFIAYPLVIIPLLTMLVLLKYICHNFWSNTIFSPSCHVTYHFVVNVYPCIMWPSWAKGSVLSLSLAVGWLIYCCVYSMLCGLSGRILWLHCHWSFWLWCILSPKNFMLRYMVHRENDHYLCFTNINHGPHFCGAALYLHHPDYLQVSFSSTEKTKKTFPSALPT